MNNNLNDEKLKFYWEIGKKNINYLNDNKNKTIDKDFLDEVIKNFKSIYSNIDLNKNNTTENIHYLIWVYSSFSAIFLTVNKYDGYSISGIEKEECYKFIEITYALNLINFFKCKSDSLDHFRGLFQNTLEYIRFLNTDKKWLESYSLCQFLANRIVNDISIRKINFQGIPIAQNWINSLFFLSYYSEFRFCQENNITLTEETKNRLKSCYLETSQFLNHMTQNNFPSVLKINASYVFDCIKYMKCNYQDFEILKGQDNYSKFIFNEKQETLEQNFLFNWFILLNDFYLSFNNKLESKSKIWNLDFKISHLIQKEQELIEELISMYKNSIWFYSLAAIKINPTINNEIPIDLENPFVLKNILKLVFDNLYSSTEKIIKFLLEKFKIKDNETRIEKIIQKLNSNHLIKDNFPKTISLWIMLSKSIKINKLVYSENKIEEPFNDSIFGIWKSLRNNFNHSHKNNILIENNYQDNLLMIQHMSSLALYSNKILINYFIMELSRYKER